jgi:hypothetical protein
MIPKERNLKPQYAGDTFKGWLIKAKRESGTTGEINPIDLSDVKVNMQIRSINGGAIVKDFSVGNGITILDATNGIFRLEAFKNPKGGEYVYDIQFTYNNGYVQTYVKGKINVLNDVSR